MKEFNEKANMDPILKNSILNCEVFPHIKNEQKIDIDDFNKFSRCKRKSIRTLNTNLSN